MSKARVPWFDFSAGLRTTRRPESIEKPWFPTFANVRVNRGGAERRPGMKRLTHIDTSAACIDFASGSSHWVEVQYDSRVWALGTEWTIEGLCMADSLAATRYLLGNDGVSTAGITVRQTSASSGSLIVDIRDTAPTLVTLTATGLAAATKVAWQVKRLGAAISLIVNGRAAVTGTMHATLSLRVPTTNIAIGQDAGANFYDGKQDFIRGFSYYKTHTKDAYMRLVNPRAPGVIFDYPMEVDTNGYVLDQSKYENHGNARNSATAGASALAVNPGPIQLIRAYKDGNVGRRLAVYSGGRPYSGVLT